ncbi:MAG: hypothetical protein PUF60_10305 [Firmicutes bacterium]|nr:hypothetical protein [Bacillota bacterium]
MKIEILFPEICNLYGELENVSYLRKSCDEAEIIETSVNSVPYFVNEEPDLIYMGTMTEKMQLLVIEKLRPYIGRIRELIDRGVHFLITGNALEVFGRYIEDADGSRTECLGMIDIMTKRDMSTRFNSLYLGNFEGMKIVGFKSQFTHSYWCGEADPAGLFDTERGPGLNPQITEEGIRINNFMATYIIGPLLVLNPPLTEYLLRSCGVSEPEAAFTEAAMDAYETRVKEFSEPKRGFYY